MNNIKEYLEIESCPIQVLFPIEEAEYQGKEVELNKPFRTPEGPKKFSVYVRNNNGNVIKVNFGDPDMDIQTDDPERRKAFRSRHNCTDKDDKTKAGYWSCKAWSADSVSKGLGLDETATAEFWTNGSDLNQIEVKFNGDSRTYSIEQFLNLAKVNDEAKKVLNVIKTKMKQIRFNGNVLQFIQKYMGDKNMVNDVFVPNGVEVSDRNGTIIQKKSAPVRFDPNEVPFS